MVTFDKIRAEFLSILDFENWDTIKEILKKPVIITNEGETFRITVERLKSRV